MPTPNAPIPNDLFLLVVLPPYFIDGFGVRPAESAGQEPTFFIKITTERRWDEEFLQYRKNLDSYVFSGDVAGFRKFAAEHREHYGRQYLKILAMPDDLCRRLLQAIAEERVRYETERMMPMQQSGKRYEA